MHWMSSRSHGGTAVQRPGAKTGVTCDGPQDSARRKQNNLPFRTALTTDCVLDYSTPYKCLYGLGHVEGRAHQ